MLYALLKFPAKLALGIYFKKININRKELLKHGGPLLLACNHPNSFLDAIILAVVFKKPVYSLARGDAFHKKWAAKILRQLNILPVYREREGAEHLHKNYHTFDACMEIFKQNGIVLIFSEALCINEWHLRPLKKGTARLALTAWQQAIPLQILPVGLNYSSFNRFGKTAFINLGNIISREYIDAASDQNGKALNEITLKIETQLSTLVYEIDPSDKQKLKKIFAVTKPALVKWLLFLPAMLGWLVNLPFYLPLQKFVLKKAHNTGHYDSIILGASFLGYPFYLLLVAIIILVTAGSFWWLSVFTFPVLAWCFVQWKD